MVATQPPPISREMIFALHRRASTLLAEVQLTKRDFHECGRYQASQFERSCANHTLWIWIDREERRNAINKGVISGIQSAVVAASR